MIVMLESFRNAVKRPVIVTSAFRCPDHNRAIDGSENSMHLVGLAADVKVEGVSARELYRIASTIPVIKGLGVSDFDNYLHIDCRKSRERVRWCYDKVGHMTTWFEAPQHSESLEYAKEVLHA
jgi:uncharacterized protein YcbK (DUF882 family)